MKSASDDARGRGWDLYQLDGFWYVNDGHGARRQPGPSKAGDKELGSGSTMDEAMKAAVKEHGRREAEQRAAKVKATAPPSGTAGAP